jgi:hypothetical protein
MMPPFVFAALVLTIAPDSAASTIEPHFEFSAMPLVNYASDTGIGFGMRGMVQRLAADIKPYQLSLELQGYATTGGAQFHFAFIDMPQIAGSPFWGRSPRRLLPQRRRDLRRDRQPRRPLHGRRE